MLCTSMTDLIKDRCTHGHICPKHDVPYDSRRQLKDPDQDGYALVCGLYGSLHSQ